MTSTSKILRPLHAIRWHLARPLQTKLVPQWVPLVASMPVMKDLAFLTVGQVLLSVPLIIIFISSWAATFASPATEGSGVVAEFAIVAAYLFANKSNSVFSFLFGLSYERLVPFHNAASVLAVVTSCFHGYVAFQFGEDGSGDRRRLDSGDSQFAANGPNTNLFRYLLDGSTNATGTLATVCMLVLVGSSFFRIVRHYCFDLWLWVHVGCAIGVILFCLMHEATLVLLVAFWWAADAAIRYLLMMGCKHPKEATIERKSESLVELKMKGFGFRAGQFVRVAVLEIGIAQFHPITISSAPYEDEVTLHIKVLGNWSRRLAELADRKSKVRVLVEGPYGGWSVDLDDDGRYPMVVCVGGGIGVTPCRSIARQLLHEKKSKERELVKLHCVWAVRDAGLLRDIPLFDETMDEDECLETSIFLTRGDGVDEETASSLNVQKGRPDLETILGFLAEEASSKNVRHVAVVGCGPVALVDSLRELCRAKSGGAFSFGGVSFDFHEEVFEY